MPSRPRYGRPPGVRVAVTGRKSRSGGISPGSASRSRSPNASNARRASSTFASDTGRSMARRHTRRGYATVWVVTPPETRGYTASKDQLMKRLNRVEGQVRGVRRMVEEERYCIDVLTQISAAQAALDKVALGLLDEHARHCVGRAEGGERVEMTDELMAAVGRLMRRG